METWNHLTCLEENSKAESNCVLCFVDFGCLNIYTSSTAQGDGGSFKNRKPIGEVGCCESRMAERIH